MSSRLYLKHSNCSQREQLRPVGSGLLQRGVGCANMPGDLIDGWCYTGDLVEGFGAGDCRGVCGVPEGSTVEVRGWGVINQTPSTCHLSFLFPVLFGIPLVQRFECVPFPPNTFFCSSPVGCPFTTLPNIILRCV